MHIHTELCGGFAELSLFLGKITPEELISVTSEKSGYDTYYTVIWKSDKKNDWR